MDARNALIVLNNDTVICNSCYEPPELEVDASLVPFAHVTEGECSVCGRAS